MTMILRSSLLAVLFILLAPLQVIAEPLWLVTPEETLKSNSAKPPFYPRVVPPLDAPVIDVITPKLDGSITSPTPILLKFVPKAPANVKPESFKAYYGTFQIDITNRLLGVAQVTAQGINLKEAALPKGSHKITLNVQDSEGRVGSKIIEFEIK
ncbi:hypothetical protein [Polynucleobacter sp. AP-Kaivos-20-H2]|uniref:hypothetical protein n=1 Tax=Polynucleobacter sp. AP-Kaivos-20-H2 TaxID=2689104 RepID=UPI001C0E28D8|nr:hypothetical protein [Polynucleobacter sp. AP-Kaivos-20-H2]MBU3603265.1 hypothetical protein [Polynucleobacter sp. AP-Kaivos-20-H2]